MERPLDKDEVLYVKGLIHPHIVPQVLDLLCLGKRSKRKTRGITWEHASDDEYQN